MASSSRDFNGTAQTAGISFASVQAPRTKWIWGKNEKKKTTRDPDENVITSYAQAVKESNYLVFIEPKNGGGGGEDDFGEAVQNNETRTIIGRGGGVWKGPPYGRRIGECTREPEGGLFLGMPRGERGGTQHAAARPVTCVIPVTHMRPRALSVTRGYISKRARRIYKYTSCTTYTWDV